ncbi:MAG: PH domain-containing protein [Clostridiales bacterium]|nr:PH domain-containing protein [Clostridiales bacterium]
MDSYENRGQETAAHPPIVERRRWLFFGLPFTFTKYELTQKKLIVHEGFFTSRENEILLYRVMDLTLTRTLIQKLFGLGSLHVISSDKTSPDLHIRNIKNVRRFKEHLSDYVEDERLRNRTRTGEWLDTDEPFDCDCDDRM